MNGLNRQKTNMRKLKTRLIATFLLSVFVPLNIVAPVSGATLPQEELKAINQYPQWVEDVCASDGTSATTAPSNVTTSDIYMIGDSVTDGAYYVAGDLKKDFAAEKWSAQVDARGGRGMNYSGGGTPRGGLPGSSLSGLDALKADKKAIQRSDTVVVALGTNESNSDLSGSQSANVFKGEMKEALKLIKSANSDAKIFWVNVSAKSTSITPYVKEYNKVISSVSESEGVTVIDTASAGIPLSPDNIHPDYVNGWSKWSEAVVAGIKGGGVGQDAAADSKPTSVQCCPSGGASESTALVGKDNEEKVWNYFKGKGLEDYSVAGIMGNISQESGFNPENIQDPAGDTKDPSGISVGWGLIQWTPGSKILDVAKQANIDGPIYELGTQLDIIWWHATNTAPPGGQNILPEFKKAKTPKEAASAWEALMEAAGSPAMDARWAAAEAAMDKYGGTGAGGATSASGGSCTCEGATTGKTVVLDPGHSGSTVIEDNDPSGVIAQDYYNRGETEAMWEVSQKITKTLESKGYKVINTKKSAKDSVGLIARSKIANNANAALAVSLHSTPGKFGSSTVGWVVPQEVGLYRQTGSNKKTFSDKEIAKTSQEYSQKILESRKKAEGDAAIHALDFTGRDLPATGNISIVQLFSKVPWVYNEVGQDGFDANKYSQGIASGILSALGSGGSQPTSGSATSGCSGAVTGDLSSTVKAYAWPEYHSAPYLKRTDEWAKVADDPKSWYVGGSVDGVKGIDCGGFVTMLVRNSGIDPNYNPEKGPTTTQMQYLDKKWQKLNVSTTKDLKPGDVAINSTHTFIYVGQIDGFDDVFASASYSTSGNGRAPMAGGDSLSGYTWYRKGQ